MSLLARLVRGLCGFVIGDDWVVAAGVTIAVAATALLTAAGAAAWWVMPVGALVTLVVTIRRAV